MSMPAGTYYIGDLCYVMHDEWTEVCSLTINEHTILDGEFQLKDGRQFAIYSTAYGDGYYSNNRNDTMLPVDAVCIGCIRIEDIDQSNPKNNIDLGMTITFESEFKTEGGRGNSHWNGDIRFGSLLVYTGEQEYLDEDYDDENES